jgi:nicotinamidase/pyrazinamidase
MNALLLVDIQRDFLPGGSLGVLDGDKIIPLANRLQTQFELVVASQDWHPPNHGSFAANHPGKRPGDVIDLGGLRQILWPVHCVQNTPGAAFAPQLHTRRIKEVFHKGTHPAIDSYSAFFDNGHRKATGLGDYLRGQGVTDLFIAGLATDYCVRFSALDALRLGFRVHVIQDACRGINLKPGDIARAIAEVRHAGGRVLRSGEVALSPA